MKSIYRIAVTTLIAGSAAWGAASADPFSGIHPLQYERFSVALGGFYSDIEGNYSLDDPNGDDGTDVDLDDLGLGDAETLPSVGFTWRLSNHSRIQAEYITVGQDTKRTINKNIDWGDLDFELGATVKTNMDMDIGRLFYGYSFVKDGNKEFGAGIGLHYATLDMSLAGNATINDEPVIDVEEGIDDWAVLPNIGIYGNYAFSSKWLIGGRVDWIGASIGDYEGELWNTEVAVQYQAFKNFGVGVSYRYLTFDISTDNREKGDWAADLEYSGPSLFLTANF